MAKTAQEAIKEANGGRLYEYYDGNGEKIGTGFISGGTDPNTMVGKKVEPTTDNSKLWVPKDVYDIKASISLNPTTGNIKISAPKDIYEMPEFKNIFKEDTLKQYSQAYKLNPEYKVTIVENNEEKEITVPEYVDKLNESLDNFIENHKIAMRAREEYSQKYGDKAKNLTDTQIQMSNQFDGKATYIPSIILGVSFFGDDKSKGNPFKQLKNKLAEDGSISLEDLKKVYTRSNLGRSEMAGILATIDGALSGSDWSTDTYYADEEGNEIYNKASAEEAAKLLAFRNFILSNDPEAEWWQQVGDNIESLGMNALYGFDRVFMNLGNMVEAPLTGGHTIENEIKDMDKAFGAWNEEGTLVNDATQVLSTLGMLGGSLAGTVALSYLGGQVAGDIAAGLGKLAGAYPSITTAAPEMAAMALRLGEAEVAASIISNINNISSGTRFVLGVMSAPAKAALLTKMAMNGITKIKNANIITEFLYDTIHDAILYDSTTLRDTLESTDQDTRDYWLGQLADNAKWWAGMGIAKGAIKYAGKTTLGKATDALVTPLVNKIAAKIGNTKQGVKDRFAGGDIVRKLEDKLEKAVEKGQTKTANRLRRKIEQEEWSELTREARAALGDIKLDWDGVKLTDDSLKEFNNLRSRVKALENGIDAYNRNISYKRQEMVGSVYDPSTGKLGYINPTLAGANVKATDFYLKLSDLGKKYNLTTAKGSMLSQDTVDYMVNKYYEGLASSFAKTGTENAAKAQNALEVIQGDLKNLKEKLPEEITSYIDNGINGKVYQSWYAAQNEYGVAKGLLDKEKIMSYDNNPIWQENGYMPIVVEHPKTGYWVENTGKIDSVIEQDFNSLTFRVAPGQHYADPELVRQSRLSNMARAEVNSQMLKAYSGFGSNATNVNLVTGEETTYVRRIKDNRKSLESAISRDSSAAFEENFNVEAQITKKRKPVKNEIVSEDKMSTIVSSMSPAQTADFLVQKKVISNRSAKLTDNVTADNYDDWYKGLNESAKKYLAQQYSVEGEFTDINNFGSLQRAIKNGGDDFEAGLQRAYLIGDKNFAKSSIANEAAKNLSNGKEAFYDGVIVAKIKGETKNILKLDTESFWNDMAPTIRGQVDDYVAMVDSAPGAKAAISALAETSDGVDDVARYIALRELKRTGMDNAYKSIDTQIDSLEGIGKLAKDDIDLLKKKAHELLDDTVDTELDAASSAARAINPDLIDAKDLYAKARDLDNKIRLAEEGMKGEGSDVVMYLDEEGRQVYAQVDPAFASLFNYRFKMDKTEASVLAKVNAATSKLFRYGTTSVNLNSFGNQMFRDFGNSVLVGGSWQTIKSNADNLRDVFGNNIVEQIKRFDPSGYEAKQLEEFAAQTGQTLESAAVSRELMRGAAISPTTTERTLYRDFMRQAYGDSSDNMLTNARNKFQKILDKYNPEELLNGKRENYLRNRVYASSLNDAMKSGYTLEQARVYAEFAMNNATTNFSRQLYHMQAIADSTPYFRAAINGTKSFWRMWSLDPVGISGRIMGGLILPVMYLTGASLGSEENRKIYQNIPEYQKQDSLVFVINGEAITAPIPQELGPLVAPFRQFVEYLYGSNKNDFWELMMNDTLGLFPYDLQGFSTIDMDTMISDPTIFDRISRGASRVFSQMAPVPLKSMYMYATGTDPYSGKNLRDKNYSYYNEETGSVEVMDYNQNTFAKWVATWFPGMSADLAEKIVSGVIGTTGSNLLSDITALVQEGPDSALSTTMENIGRQISNPFNTPQYNMADAVWNRAVRQLEAEKESILNSDEMKVLLQEMQQTKDPEKRRDLYAKISDITNNYQQKVGDTVKRLESVYEGTYDRKKFAATIQLLNFNTDPVYQTSIQATSDAASSPYWNGRDQAIRTMVDLGITGSNDMSIFGYLALDKNGRTVVKYSSPTAIMDIDNQWQNQDEINLANIKALVSGGDLWEAHESVKKQIDKIYGSKKKISKSDKANIEAIQINWNAQVAKTLAPYLKNMTPEAALNNNDVLNYLYPLIEVPYSWEVDNKGKSVYLGDRGNKKKAYYESWIKSMFSINDPYKGQY